MTEGAAAGCEPSPWAVVGRGTRGRFRKVLVAPPDPRTLAALRARAALLRECAGFSHAKFRTTWRPLPPPGPGPARRLIRDAKRAGLLRTRPVRLPGHERPCVLYTLTRRGRAHLAALEARVSEAAAPP